MRFLMLAAAFAGFAVAAPANAQAPGPYVTSLVPPPLPARTPHVARSPHPHGSGRPAPFMTFTNPSGLSSAGGSSCARNGVVAQGRVNPITGQPQAATIVSIPVTSHSGTMKSATNHQQQIEACAHAH
jgi:hypothetical protein